MVHRSFDSRAIWNVPDDLPDGIYFYCNNNNNMGQLLR